jgi:hypothetical protein
MSASKDVYPNLEQLFRKDNTLLYMQPYQDNLDFKIPGASTNNYDMPQYVESGQNGTGFVQRSYSTVYNNPFNRTPAPALINLRAPTVAHPYLPTGAPPNAPGRPFYPSPHFGPNLGPTQIVTAMETRDTYAHAVLFRRALYKIFHLFQIANLSPLNFNSIANIRTYLEYKYGSDSLKKAIPKITKRLFYITFFEFLVFFFYERGDMREIIYELWYYIVKPLQHLDNNPMRYFLGDYNSIQSITYNSLDPLYVKIFKFFLRRLKFIHDIFHVDFNNYEFDKYDVFGTQGQKLFNFGIYVLVHFAMSAILYYIGELLYDILSQLLEFYIVIIFAFLWAMFGHIIKDSALYVLICIVLSWMICKYIIAAGYIIFTSVGFVFGLVFGFIKNIGSSIMRILQYCLNLYDPNPNEPARPPRDFKKIFKRTVISVISTINNNFLKFIISLTVSSLIVDYDFTSEPLSHWFERVCTGVEFIIMFQYFFFYPLFLLFSVIHYFSPYLLEDPYNAAIEDSQSTVKSIWCAITFLVKKVWNLEWVGSKVIHYVRTGYKHHYNTYIQIY